MTDLLEKYPSIDDLRVRAQRRLPHFVWEFLDSGTGNDLALQRNRSALDRITLSPRHSKTRISPRLTTKILGQQYDVPFGIAPIGTTGLIWPGGEQILAKTAAKHNLPYCLSTAACETPEIVGPLTEGLGWFQLYPPLDPSVRMDLLKRAKDSGFKTLVLTVDVPEYGLRERPRRAGLRSPPRVTMLTLLQIAARPRWAFATLVHGAPKFRTLTPYLNEKSVAEAAEYVLTKLNQTVDADYLASLRDQWTGPFLLKGILHPEDAKFAVSNGVDGIIVSNHGGRQFDAAPAAINALPRIVKAVGGKTTIVFDSGVRSGPDIVKAIAYGADFVLLGRAFIYGIAALGARGGDHACRVLKEDLTNSMIQLGARSIDKLRELQVSAS